MKAAQQTFHLQLNFAATVAELSTWLAAATPGARAQYASGLDLPADAPGVVLVREWMAAGLVVTFRQRDTADPRRWLFWVEKSGVGAGAVRPAALHHEGGGCGTQSPRTRAEKAALLAHLRANEGWPCPSLRQLAAVLELGERGAGEDAAKRRARYLLDLLLEEGAVALEPSGIAGARVVKLGAGEVM